MVEELTMVSERTIALALGPHVKNLTLTVFQINSAMAAQDLYSQNVGLERAIGKNALSNLSKFLGLVGIATNLSQSLHLPNSVLNAGAVGQTLGDFSRNLAFLKAMKNNSLAAFMPPLPFGNLLNIPGLANLASLAGINLNSIAALGDLAALAGGIGALGGLNINQLSLIMLKAEIASQAVDLTADLIRNMGLK